MVATSPARVSSTLSLTRSRNVAPASSSTRLMLVTTLANCASKLSGSSRLSSKPGMPEMNNRSPVRAANDSGGALIPGGGGKCWIGMGHLRDGQDGLTLKRISCPAALAFELQFDRHSGARAKRASPESITPAGSDGVDGPLRHRVVPD